MGRALAPLGPTDLVGRSFGVLKVRLDGLEYDFSLPRRESKTGVGHRGFAVTPDSKLTEIEVNINKILSGKADDFKLLANDVLVVPTSGRKVFVYDFLPATYSILVNAAIYKF